MSPLFTNGFVRQRRVRAWLGPPLYVLMAVGAGCGSKDSSSEDTSVNGAPASAGVVPGGAWLVDVTREAGIDFVHDRHHTGDYRFPEMEGAGIGVLDYDNDGHYDLYFVQGGRMPGVDGGRDLSDQLLRNRGDGSFENVTEKARIHANGYGMGVTCGDYDNDGDVDIFVANVGPNTMLRNNDDGTFTDVTAELGLGDARWGLGTAFADYDADGWLDLIVTNYAVWDPDNEVECTMRDTGKRDYCGPASHDGDRDILYHNRGDGTFEDVSAPSGVGTLAGAGMGIAVADFNTDGRLDIYIANDTDPNRLWIQQADHTFVDKGAEMLCDVNEDGRAEASMGVVVEDFDGNGLTDLLMTHYRDESNTLYLNQGGMFEDASRRSRMRSASLRYTAFGINTLNLFDDDRLLIFVANGKVTMDRKVDDSDTDPYAEPDQLLKWSRDDMLFDDVSEQAGPALQHVGVSRGSATVDYDGDGDLDLVVTECGGPARLLRNDAGDAKRGLLVRCIGPEGERDAYGARVEVDIAGRKRSRLLYTNGSYASGSDPRVHFGLGDADRVNLLTVHWLDGTRSMWRDVLADQVFVARHDDDRGRSLTDATQK